MPRRTMLPLLVGLIGFSSLAGQSRVALADSGQPPVAVRWWGQAMVSIETYWNLNVVIDPHSTTIGDDHPELNADLVLITHNFTDQSITERVEGEPTIVRGVDDQGRLQPINHVLDRLPNEPQSTWRDARLRIARSPHAIVVTNMASERGSEQGAGRGANSMFLIEVDGVRIVHCGDLGQSELNDEQLARLGAVDLLLIPLGGTHPLEGGQAARIVRDLKPRMVMPIRYKTPDAGPELESVEQFLGALGADYEELRPVGNTIAICALEQGTSRSRHVVVSSDRPWKMSEQLAELFSRKEAACRASQAVFAKLSAAQMNFRPKNGTHTPRWNAEHMMGRELGFFSQIYAQRDPAVPHLDLNPAQMPPDYQAAHPDWTGEEEARQMQRVAAFTRRFAYLLDGVDLDEQPRGSFWTIRGLCEQMEAHYDEHTANVRKKFELPDWPQE